MSDLRMKWPGFLDMALTLSYDDGVTSDRKMIEILNQYGVKCTFNLNSGTFNEAEPDNLPKGQTARMSKEHVFEVYNNSGHEVAVHTLTHPWMTNLPTQEIIREVLEDRKNIEQLFSTVVRGMAYPYGITSNEIVDTLKCCGIAYARTTVSTENFNIPTDWLRMPATCHHKHPHLFDLANRFLHVPFPFPRLFYLWGHSYEFEREDNWDILEKFCTVLGRREDIWYATNIEVYDYVQAFQSLQFSVEMDIVHNPSALPICFSLGGKMYCVESGATIQLR